MTVGVDDTKGLATGRFGKRSFGALTEARKYE